MTIAEELALDYGLQVAWARFIDLVKLRIRDQIELAGSRPEAGDMAKTLDEVLTRITGRKP